MECDITNSIKKKNSKDNTFKKKQEQSTHGPQQNLEVGTNAVEE